MSKRSPLVIATLCLAGLLLVMPLANRIDFDERLPVLAEPPMALDGWIGERIAYCHKPGCGSEVVGVPAGPAACPRCGTPLLSLSPDEADLLPRDTLLHKTRFHRADNVPSVYVVSIVISSRDRSSIHRPEVCLVGQGSEIVRSFVRQVPRPNAPPLPITVLEMLQHNRAGAPTPHFYAYWFSGAGHETASHAERMAWMAFDRVLRGKASRWAYIAVGGARDPDGRYLSALDRFVGELAPSLAP